MTDRPLCLCPLPSLILIGASDGAGEVVEIGASVTDFKKGDRVTVNIFQGYHQGEDVPFSSVLRGLGGAVHGVASDFFLLDSSDLVHIPSYMSYEEASTLPIAATTAWNMLYGHYPKLSPGDTVLCLGTGGVSLFGAQIALAAGAKVIITSSNSKKLERVKGLLEPLVSKDASKDTVQTINYSEIPQWDQEVIKLTGGRKVDFVIEIGGKLTLTKSIRSTRQGGLVAISGYLGDFAKPSNKNTSVDEEEPDIAKEILFSATNVRGNFVGSKESFNAMNRALEAKGVHPIIDKTFRFEDLKKAYEYVQSGNHLGKVVIMVD